MNIRRLYMSFFFFFNDTATTEIYTLSLHDALPISIGQEASARTEPQLGPLSPRIKGLPAGTHGQFKDRKSTRLNSSHSQISYAVFCLKKKKKKPSKESHNTRQTQACEQNTSCSTVM